MNPTPLDLNRELYECHADLCKVLSHPARLRILHTLRKKERSVTELARRLRLGIGNLSQHLNMMKQRRVLVSRKEGNTVFYRLDNPKMLKAFDLIREIFLEQMQRENLLVRHIERARSGSPAATLSRRRERARQHG